MHIERRVEVRFLAGPDAVRDFGHDGAADRAVGADGLDDFDGAVGRACCAGLLHRAAGGCDRSQTADGQTGSTQERAAVNRFGGNL